VLNRLRAHNQLRLGRLKQPEAIHLVNSLPRSATGKVLCRELRNLLNTTTRKST
jgi:acyl-coenzyme A synthetase/AMP-(fatty) acid ligase